MAKYMGVDLSYCNTAIDYKNLNLEKLMVAKLNLLCYEPLMVVIKINY